MLGTLRQFPGARRTPALAAGVVLAALLLAACGGGEPAPQSPLDQAAIADDGAPAASSPAESPNGVGTKAGAEAGPDVDADGEADAEADAEAETSPPTAPQTRRLLMPDRRCDDCTLVDAAFSAPPGATAYFGVLDGAAYRILVPDDWNGALVLWAHGFSGLNEEGTDLNPALGFGNLMPVRLLPSFGYAWAASTYCSNGFVPALGVDELLRLKDRFVEEVGPPRRVYVLGASMGGATAQLMAQEFPEEIDGALAFCGALGNAAGVDFVASWHAVAAWILGDFPSRPDGDGILAWAARLGTIEDGELHLTPDGDRFAAVIRALTGGDRWGFLAGLAGAWSINWEFGAIVWPDILAGEQARQPGAVISHDSSLAAFDTVDVVYAVDPPGAIDIDALNAEVVRFAATTDARRDPALGIATGGLEVPLLTLKGTGDIETPISLDAAYQLLVRQTGYSDNLVTRAVRRAGHCNFSTNELVRALQDLSLWIEDGIRPAGEDLTGDLAAVGVDFTAPFDPDDPFAPLP